MTVRLPWVAGGLFVLGLVSLAHGQPRGWFDLSPDEQRRAWENYQRYQRLPDRQREKLEQRYQEYQALPPEERSRLRQNYRDLQDLDGEQRRRFGQQYQRWRSDRKPAPR